MERTESTIDKNSSICKRQNNFDLLDPIDISELNILVFMKPNADIIGCHIIKILTFLQTYVTLNDDLVLKARNEGEDEPNDDEQSIEYQQSMNLYVTEEVLELLKTASEATQDQSNTESTAGEETKHDISQLDLTKLKTFSPEDQCKINRIITVGGDGTVVHAIKLFYKEKCHEIISFGEESLGYL